MAKALMEYFIFKKGPFCNSPIKANAFINTDATYVRPDIQFHFALLHLGDNYSADLYNFKTLPHSNGFTILAVLLHPESRGYITLRTNNVYDLPVMQSCFLESGNDKTALLKGLRKAMEVADAKAFRAYSPDGLNHPLRNASDDALTDHINKSLETLFHPVGTCKMGSNALAVVNDRLQVHGVKNLRVIDASIMPTIISGNTNAASIMIGEKGADFIKEG